jgi:hypothetical protein
MVTTPKNRKEWEANIATPLRKLNLGENHLLSQEKLYAPLDAQGALLQLVI